MHALVANVQGEPTGPLIAFSDAAKEIADALKIPNEAASMTLYGLCATGYVRWTDISGVIVEEDDLTVANFSDKPALVVADDVRSYLVDWSPVLQPKRRDHVIAVLLFEGYNPPRNIKWKPFCDLIRDKCNGWLKPGEPALSFGDRVKTGLKTLHVKCLLALWKRASNLSNPSNLSNLNIEYKREEDGNAEHSDR